MDERILQTMTDWAAEHESVRALFETGPRVNKAAVQRESDPYEFIVLVRAYTDEIEQEDWSARFGEETLQVGKTQIQPDPAYRILLASDIRLDLVVAEEARIRALLAEDSLVAVCYDPEGAYADRSEATDLSRRTKKPTEQEYEMWCQKFFKEATDTAAALVSGNLIVAQRVMERLRTTLWKMNEAAVASDSSFLINLGRDGCNLKAYMDEVEFDHLARSYARTDAGRIWDALFQACMLFRKAGLRLNEREGFAYPKKMDVNMMHHLRDLWEAMR